MHSDSDAQATPFSAGPRLAPGGWSRLVTCQAPEPPAGFAEVAIVPNTSPAMQNDELVHAIDTQIGDITGPPRS